MAIVPGAAWTVASAPPANGHDLGGVGLAGGAPPPRIGGLRPTEATITGAAGSPRREGWAPKRLG